MRQITENKVKEDTEAYKKELLEQKSRIEDSLKRIDRKNLDDQVISSLRKVQEINNSLSDLQNSLNLVWKRTQQVEEELRNLLHSG